MDSRSQHKVINKGFMIIRADDQPQPRIKFKGKGHSEWKTLEKFITKAQRDRRMTDLLQREMIICD